MVIHLYYQYLMHVSCNDLCFVAGLFYAAHTEPNFFKLTEGWDWQHVVTVYDKSQGRSTNCYPLFMVAIVQK